LQESDILQYALSNGIIDLLDVQEKIEMNKRKETLNKHPYSIWQGKNNLWYTYLPDETKNNNRTLKKRTSEESIYNLIVDYWENEHEKVKAEPITLEKLFPEWLRFKSAHTNASSYVKRISADWKRYYEGEKIVKTPLIKLTGIQIDEWIHTKIKESNMTKTQYFNMSIIFRQSMEYAMNKKYIMQNPFAEVKINKKMLSKPKKKSDETQVFLVEEKPLIIAEAYKDLEQRPKITAPLGIILMFYLGIRAGELVALKVSDFDFINNRVNIQRMEVRDYVTEDQVNFKLTGRTVVEHTKTNAGERSIYMTSEAKEIVERIIEINKKYGFVDEDYLFVQYHCRKKVIGRTNTYTMAKKLMLYCERAGISQKSMHKIRKTYISTLIDNRININEIKKLVGHEDERTTFGNYCYNRFSDKQTENAIEAALCDNKPKKEQTNVICFEPDKVIKGNQKICSL